MNVIDSTRVTDFILQRTHAQIISNAVVIVITVYLFNITDKGPEGH